MTWSNYKKKISKRTLHLNKDSFDENKKSSCEFIYKSNNKKKKKKIILDFELWKIHCFLFLEVNAIKPTKPYVLEMFKIINVG